MQYNKVEICGVNTARLTVLSAKEKTELMQRIKAGDKVAQDKFVNGNLRLVLSVIQRFAGRGEEMDDLFQVGCIGLIKAIKNFDVNQNVQFSTYAVPMIIGELRRYMRDNSAIRVSRSLRDAAYKALTEKERLTKQLGREPTIDEIAVKLGMKRADVSLAMDAIMDPISLYEPIYSENGDAVYVMDQICDNHNHDNDWIEEIGMREAIDKLTDREKQILSKRFFEGKTQMQVAAEVGISQAQVSRLEKSALSRIKKQ